MYHSIPVRGINLWILIDAYVGNGFDFPDMTSCDFSNIPVLFDVQPLNDTESPVFLTVSN